MGREGPLSRYFHFLRASLSPVRDVERSLDVGVDLGVDVVDDVGGVRTVAIVPLDLVLVAA